LPDPGEITGLNSERGEYFLDGKPGRILLPVGIFSPERKPFGSQKLDAAAASNENSNVSE
jgi:hypothetical protein